MEYSFMYDTDSIMSAAQIIAVYYKPKFNVPIERFADHILNGMYENDYCDHEGHFVEMFGGNPFYDNGHLNKTVFRNYFNFLVKLKGLSFLENEERLLSYNT